MDSRSWGADDGRFGGEAAISYSFGWLAVAVPNGSSSSVCGGAWLLMDATMTERMTVLLYLAGIVCLIDSACRARVSHIDHHYYLPRSEKGSSLFF